MAVQLFSPLEQAFRSLSVNDLARSSTVSKKWRASAEKVRQTSVFPGVNAGFLYQLTDSRLNRGYLYVERKNDYTADVLTANPLLRSVFAKSPTIVFLANPDRDEKSVHELLKSMDNHYSDLKRNFTAEQIQLRLKEIYDYLLNRRSPQEFARFREVARKAPDDAAELMLAYLFYCSSWTESAEKFNPGRFLKQKSGPKERVVLDRKENDFPGVAFARFMQLLQHDDGFFILEAFSKRLGLEKAWLLGRADFKGLETSEKVIRKKPEVMSWNDANDIIKEYHLEQLRLTSKMEHLIDEGSMDVQTMASMRTRLKEIKETLDSLFATQDKKISRYHQETERLKQVFEDQKDRLEYLYLIGERLSHQEAEAIVSLLPRSPLVIAKDSHMIPSLQALGVGVHGPLKVPTKPIGLLWHLIAPNGNWGYFCGSIHVAPPRLLDFNEQMLACFNVCQTLAVETDVTLEEVRKRIAIAEGMQTEKTLAALKPDEKKKLIAIFRKFLSLPKVNLSADLLPQEEEAFLKAVIPKFQGILYSAAGMEDGIDFRFLERAKQRPMPIFDLERADHHVELIEDMPSLNRPEILSGIAKMSDLKVESIFEDLVLQFKEGVDQFAKMWESGLTEEWEERQKTEDRTRATKEEMRSRNREMAVHMDLLVSADKKPFAIAGAAHAFGEDSILKILQKNFGYKIEQLVYEQPVLKVLSEMQQRI